MHYLVRLFFMTGFISSSFLKGMERLLLKALDLATYKVHSSTAQDVQLSLNKDKMHDFLGKIYKQQKQHFQGLYENGNKQFLELAQQKMKYQLLSEEQGKEIFSLKNLLAEKEQRDKEIKKQLEEGSQLLQDKIKEGETLKSTLQQIQQLQNSINSLNQSKRRVSKWEKLLTPFCLITGTLAVRSGLIYLYNYFIR